MGVTRSSWNCQLSDLPDQVIGAVWLRLRLAELVLNSSKFVGKLDEGNLELMNCTFVYWGGGWTTFVVAWGGG